MNRNIFLVIFTLLTYDIYAQVVLKDSLQNVKLGLINKNALLKKDSQTGRVKNLIKPSQSLFNLKQLPKVKGISGFEGYHTNFQNPRVLSQPTYLRFNSNVSLTYAGLPFLMDAYFTSEPKTFYNSNRLSVQFDKDAFLRNLTQMWQQKLNKANGELNSKKAGLAGLEKNKSTLDQQQQQLENQKQGLLNQYQNQFDQYQTKYTNDIGDFTDSLKEVYSDSLKNIYSDTKGKFSDNLKQVYTNNKDSGMYYLSYRKQKATDSMHLARLASDTQKIHDKIEQGKKKYTEYKSKKQSLDSSINADTAIIGKYKRMIENPQVAAGNWLKEQGFPKSMVFAASVKNFQTGNVNPFIHDYSLSGVGFRGLNAAFESGKLDIVVAGGKGIPMDILNYDRKNNKYTRLYLATDITYKLSSNTSLSFFGHHISDPKDEMTNLGKAALQNQVAGIQIKAKPYGLLDLDASFAKSNYQILNNNIQAISYTGNSELNLKLIQKSRSAWNIKASKQISKNFEVMGIYRFVGPMFKDLGNPFMRTNYLEYNGKLISTFWKTQLKTTVFYKTLQDNPLHIAEVTNRTKGYGMSLQTKFKNKKLPNGNFSISPYEQGNNHPDSLFRVNNRLSIITAGLNYRINKGYFKYTVLVYGTQSQMQFNEKVKAKVRTITISQDIGLGRYITSGFTGTIMRTKPGVDSSQANIWQGRFGFTSKKGNSIVLSSQWSQYLNGAYRKGVALSVSFRYGKHLRFFLRSGYDRYHKLWGLGEREAFWGMGRVEFVF